MSLICTADLHLTDNPKDEYRWELFPWLRSQVKKTGAKHVLILGDTTDAKDRHSAVLVNRLVSEVHKLSQVTNVIFLAGNHDCINEGSPFFAFIQKMDSRVAFITKPEVLELDDGSAEGSRTSKPSLFLPSTRNYKQAWAGLDFNKTADRRPQTISYIFTHQTYDGALAENGQNLEGVPPSVFADVQGQVVSGDIHVPQKIGRNIEYVGAPYRIHFGDSFTPRLMLLKHGKKSNLHFPGLSRELLVGSSVQTIAEHDFEPGTQVKIRIRLKRAEYPEWPAMRKELQALAEQKQWDLCGGLELTQLETKDRKAADEDQEEVALSPEQVVEAYARRKKLDKATHASGLAFLKEART